MPTPYKLKILNGVLKLKTFSDQVLSILGIKDLGTQTGDVTNGYVDWSIQHLTKTTAQWTADTTTILLRGQLGVEDTGNTTFKIKVGNGSDLWSALGYAGGSSASTWGTITGTLSDQTDLQNALNAKENSITAGTTAQYWRGDKTFQTLDKTAVGLGNVDNTSDANKPISTATQTALDGKVDENVAIVGATKTKITYDSKGLVTSGADATTADIADSLNKRYQTDAQQTYNDATSSIQTQLNTKSPYPVAEWYSDSTTFSPGDGGVYYSSRLNNNAPETVSTYRPTSKKLNGNWLVQVNGIITTTLGSSEGITIELLNITAGTSETLTTGFTLNKRVSSSGYFSSTLASAIDDEMQIRVTFPTWATNPTNVQLQFFLKQY